MFTSDAQSDRDLQHSSTEMEITRSQLLAVNQNPACIKRLRRLRRPSASNPQLLLVLVLLVNIARAVDYQEEWEEESDVSLQYSP